MPMVCVPLFDFEARLVNGKSAFTIFYLNLKLGHVFICVFSFFDSEAEALRVKSAVEVSYSCFVARGLNKIL